MTSSPSILFGRFLLGLYFLVPGIMKFADQAGTLDYMQNHAIGFTLPLLWISGLTNILGGLMLMLGRHVKLVAFGFVAYILIVNFMLHDFWTMSGDAAQRETQNFIKNLGILAGLLVLAGVSPTRSLRLKDCWKSDKAVGENL